MISTAIEYGGSESKEPLDHGWMYGRSFEDMGISGK
jgi:predicted lactoylglutathione lyase